MRKLLISLFLGFFVMGLAKPCLCEGLKIGYVNVIEAFNEYKKTKDYDKTLEEKQKVKEEERDKKITELKKLQDQYVLLSDEQKEKKKSEVEQKAKDLDQFNRQTLSDLKKQQNDYMLEITEEIEKVIKKQAKEGGYDFVLNEQTVLYSNESFDLTASVLNELNQGYNKK